MTWGPRDVRCPHGVSPSLHHVPGKGRTALVGVGSSRAVLGLNRLFVNDFIIIMITYYLSAASPLPVAWPC